MKPNLRTLAFASSLLVASLTHAAPAPDAPWAVPQGEAMDVPRDTAPALSPAPATPTSEAAAEQVKGPLFSSAARLPLLGAAGDSLSTYIALHQPGVVEKNALINTSALGLAGLFVAKAGLVYWADHHEAGKTRASSLKTLSGLWSGLTISNLAIAAGAATPVGLALGTIAGVFSYFQEAKRLREEGAALAAVSGTTPAPAGR